MTNQLSEEHKQKLSLNHRKYQTLETREKISKTLLGKSKPEQFAEKCRNRRYPIDKYPNFGKRNKHLSEETKQKMMGRIPWNKGKKDVYSKETLEKMRISSFNYYKNMKNIKSPRIGKYEKSILDELQNKIGFSIKRQFFINGYFLDGYCQELNLAIEVDEPNHYKKGILKDKDTKKQQDIIDALNCSFIRIKIPRLRLIKNKEVIKNGVFEGLS